MARNTQRSANCPSGRQAIAAHKLVLDENGEEVLMTETIDYGDEDLAPLIEGRNFLNNEESESFERAGYSAVSD